MSKPKLGALAFLAYALIGFFFGVTVYFILDTFRLSYVVQTTPVPWLVTGVLGALFYLSMSIVLLYFPPTSPVALMRAPRRLRRPRDFNNSGSHTNERNA